MAIDETETIPAAPLMIDGSGWRANFSAGFLDGDSDRGLEEGRSSYVIGWKLGRVFRGLRMKAV